MTPESSAPYADAMRDLTRPVRRLPFGACVDIMRDRETLAAIVRSGVHPTVPLYFAKAWGRAGSAPLRHDLAEDALWFAALRVLLPPYSGGPLELYRGQPASEPLGMGWTISRECAERFAQWGMSYRPAIERNKRRGKRPSPDGRVFRCTVHREIICALFTAPVWDFSELEVVIDPRGVAAEPAHLPKILVVSQFQF